VLCPFGHKDAATFCIFLLDAFDDQIDLAFQNNTPLAFVRMFRDFGIFIEISPLR
jgi:hypothetical protein